MNNTPIEKKMLHCLLQKWVLILILRLKLVPKTWAQYVRVRASSAALSELGHELVRKIVPIAQPKPETPLPLSAENHGRHSYQKKEFTLICPRPVK